MADQAHSSGSESDIDDLLFEDASDETPIDAQLTGRFAQAVSRVPALSASSTTNSGDLLYLYARYKLINEGPCSASSSSKPSMFDQKGRQKWNAWSEIGEISKTTAMEEYCRKVEELSGAWCAAMNDDASKSTEDGGAFGCAVSRPKFNVEDVAAERTSPSDDALDMVKAGEIDAVRKLSNGSLKQARDSFNLTVLHWAADRGFAEVLEELLSRGVLDVNAQDEEGQTPLHYAVTCEHRPAAEVLLRFGADPDLCDNEGMSSRSLDPTIGASLNASTIPVHFSLASVNGERSSSAVIQA